MEVKAIQAAKNHWTLDLSGYDDNFLGHLCYWSIAPHDGAYIFVRGSGAGVVAPCSPDCGVFGPSERIERKALCSGRCSRFDFPVGSMVFSGCRTAHTAEAAYLRSTLFFASFGLADRPRGILGASHCDSRRRAGRNSLARHPACSVGYICDNDCYVDRFCIDHVNEERISIDDVDEESVSCEQDRGPTY